MPDIIEIRDVGPPGRGAARQLADMGLIEGETPEDLIVAMDARNRQAAIEAAAAAGVAVEGYVAGAEERVVAKLADADGKIGETESARVAALTAMAQTEAATQSWQASVPSFAAGANTAAQIEASATQFAGLLDRKLDGGDVLFEEVDADGRRLSAIAQSAGGQTYRVAPLPQDRLGLTDPAGDEAVNITADQVLDSDRYVVFEDADGRRLPLVADALDASAAADLGQTFADSPDLAPQIARRGVLPAGLARLLDRTGRHIQNCAPVGVRAATPYCLSSGDELNGVEMTGPGEAHIDCQALAYTDQRILIPGGSSATFYCGPGAAFYAPEGDQHVSWVGANSDTRILRVTAPAGPPARVNVWRTGARRMALTGAPWMEVAGNPAPRTRSYMLLGQSGAERDYLGAGMYGLQQALREHLRSPANGGGSGQSYGDVSLFPIRAASGGSGVVEGNGNSADNYWMRLDGTPGPLAERMLARMAYVTGVLGQPPGHANLDIGQSDAIALTTDVDDGTRHSTATLRRLALALLALMRGQGWTTSVTLAAAKDTNVAAAPGWSRMFQVMKGLCDEASVFFDCDTVDLPRAGFNDGHLEFAGQRIARWRGARAFLRAQYGEVLPYPPRWTSVARVGARKARVAYQFDTADGWPFLLPDRVSGAALLPAGSLFDPAVQPFDLRAIAWEAQSAGNGAMIMTFGEDIPDDAQFAYPYNPGVEFWEGEFLRSGLRGEPVQTTTGLLMS